MCNGRTSAAEGPLSDNDLSSFQADGITFSLIFLFFHCLIYRKQVTAHCERWMQLVMSYTPTLFFSIYAPAENVR